MNGVIGDGALLEDQYLSKKFLCPAVPRRGPEAGDPHKYYHFQPDVSFRLNQFSILEICPHNDERRRPRWDALAAD